MISSVRDRRFAAFPHARILWGFVRPHRWRLALGLLLGLGSTAAALATPLVTKQLLDNVGMPQNLAVPISALLALVVLGAGFTYTQAVLLGDLAENTVFSARRMLVGRFLRGRLGDLQGRSSGEVVTRVTSDTLLLREATSSSLVNVVNETIALIGALVLMAILDVTLFLVALVAIAVIAALAGSLMPRVGRAQHRAQEAVGRLGTTLESAVRAVRTVKSAGAEARENRRILDDATDAMRSGRRANRTEALAWTIAGSGIQLAILVILAVGAWRIGTGGLSVPVLVAFLLYAFQLAEPASSLTMHVATLQAGAAAAARIRETEDIDEEDTARGRDVPAASDEAPVLALENVSFSYPGREDAPALRGVSFTAPRRGHLALVGPSGAGKTSLFSLLLGFHRPDHGTVLVNGADHAQLALGAVRERIAYVEQETPLLAGTVRYNLSYRHPDATDDELWAALDAVRLRSLVAALPGGLDEPITAMVLSGGQRQRIGLARALVRPPDVLLLDEATAQLDAITEQAVHEAIDEVASRGLVITIAHRLSTVMDADRILVLERGSIVAAGTHSELLQISPLYARLVTALRMSTQPVEPAADENAAPQGALM